MLYACSLLLNLKEALFRLIVLIATAYLAYRRCGRRETREQQPRKTVEETLIERYMQRG